MHPHHRQPPNKTTPHHHAPSELQVRDITSLDVDTSEGEGSQWGTGGMATKLTAARIGTAAGVTVVIMSAAAPELVMDAICATPAAAAATPADAEMQPQLRGRRGASLGSCGAAARVGTTFLPIAGATKGRKRWILSVPVRGALVLKPGVADAVSGDTFESVSWSQVWTAWGSGGGVREGESGIAACALALRGGPLPPVAASTMPTLPSRSLRSDGNGDLSRLLVRTRAHLLHRCCTSTAIFFFPHDATRVAPTRAPLPPAAQTHAPPPPGAARRRQLFPARRNAPHPNTPPPPPGRAHTCAPTTRCCTSMAIFSRTTRGAAFARALVSVSAKELRATLESGHWARDDFELDAEVVPT
eukprot:364088-Chlamydomonas_euryale.AAC.4